MDLDAIRGWKRLRTCRLYLDVTEEDLASPPPRNVRIFAQLKNSDLVPSLVNLWKKELNVLEEMQVSCRVVEEDDYRTDPVGSSLLAVYPLIFGSKCDCGAVHFCIDAEEAMAKSCGFLEADE